MCQTLGIGILLLGLVTPFVRPEVAVDGDAWINGGLGAALAACLILYAHWLTGEAVRAEP